MSTVTTEPRPARSTVMTDKALAGMTRFGRKVTFFTPDLDDDVVGYVIGFDDEAVNIASVRPDGAIRVCLRTRNYIAGYDQGVDNDLNAERPDVRAKLEEMINPFRNHVMTKYFGRRSAATSSE